MKGLADMRMLRAQLREGAKSKRKEEEYRAAGTAVAAMNAASDAGEDSVLAVRLSPSSASAPSVTSVPLLLEVEPQVCDGRYHRFTLHEGDGVISR